MIGFRRHTTPQPTEVPGILPGLDAGSQTQSEELRQDQPTQELGSVGVLASGVSTEQVNTPDRDLRIDNALTDSLEPILSDESLWHPGNSRTADLTFVFGRQLNQAPWQANEIVPTSALAPFYGEKIVVDANGEPSLEKTGIDTITRIHETISSGVLDGENIRVARTLYPPDPKNVFSKENLLFWLDNVKQDTWPIYIRRNSPGNEMLDGHDSSALHIGNMATLPREVQDDIGEAAGYQIDWMTTHPEDDVLLLSGERPNDHDPYSANKRGNAFFKNGIDTIDQVTDDGNYMRLLAKLVSLPVGQCREFVDSLKPRSEYADTDTPEGLAADQLAAYTRQAIDLANFNTRHRTTREGKGRTINEEEIAQVSAGAKAGLLRVALKIRGEWTDDIEQQPIAA